MRLIRSFLIVTMVCFALVSARAQEHSWAFNIGGGPGFPLSNLSNFVNTGGNFVIGAGYNFPRLFTVNSEFMWHDLPINQSTKNLLRTPGASARQYSWTFNPSIPFPLGEKFGTYAIGGIGWYHRSGETTTPGTGVICDPYWSWWFGCTIGTVNFVTGSRSENSFGENIGGGFTYRIGESGVKLYTEVRYHHAGYNRVATDLLPLTFGLRW